MWLGPEHDGREMAFGQLSALGVMALLEARNVMVLVGLSEHVSRIGA